MLEQGYTIVQAAASLGITDKILYSWLSKLKKQAQGDTFAELLRKMYTMPSIEYA